MMCKLQQIQGRCWYS